MGVPNKKQSESGSVIIQSRRRADDICMKPPTKPISIGKAQAAAAPGNIFICVSDVVIPPFSPPNHGENKLDFVDVAAF